MRFSHFFDSLDFPKKRVFTDAMPSAAGFQPVGFVFSEPSADTADGGLRECGGLTDSQKLGLCLANDTKKPSRNHHYPFALGYR